MSMIGIGVAVGGASLISGAASAVLGSNAAKTAAGQEEAGEAGAKNALTSGYTTTAGLEAPATNLGYGADQILASLYGISNPTSSGTPGTSIAGGIGGPAAGMPGASSGSGVSVGGSTTTGNPNYSAFTNSPGYQYQISQAAKTTQAAAAAGGNIFSTNTLNATNANVEGVAAGQYNNYVSQLMGMANLGQSAVGTTAGAAQSTASGIASADVGQGEAAAGGTTGAAGAIAGGLSTAASGIAGAAGMLSYANTNLPGAPNASGVNGNTPPSSSFSSFTANNPNFDPTKIGQ